MKQICAVCKCFFTFLLLIAITSCVDRKNTPKEAQVETEAKKPNIIFIMADDLGYADITPYGQQHIKTPILQKMAQEGMKFTQFYAGTAVCAPSRASLMTGLNTGHVAIRGNKQHGKRNGQMPLSQADTTIAMVLKEAGYLTGLVGKWGLGNPETSGDPSMKGFDMYYGYTDQILAHNYYPEYLWKNGEKQMLDNEVHYLDKNAWHQGLGSYSTSKNTYSHDMFMKTSLEFITDASKTEQPFFLYLSLTIPHDNGEQSPDMVFEVPDQGIYKDLDWGKNEKDYAAMITYMDAGIGEILKLIKDLNIDDNTLVVFTSDNGPMRNMPTTDFFNSNGPLRGGKRDLYEGGIRVPFIARWKGRIEGGTSTSHQAAFWDLLPTFADLAAIKPPQKLDGHSFLPTLLGKPQNDPSSLYFEIHFSDISSQAIRKGDYKMVKNFFAKDSISTELYNLKDDIGENINIAKVNQGLVLKLDSLMQESRTPSTIFPLINQQ